MEEEEAIKTRVGPWAKSSERRLNTEALHSSSQHLESGLGWVTEDGVEMKSATEGEEADATEGILRTRGSVRL